MNIGIDPGLTGAIAVFSYGFRACLGLYDLPTMPRMTGKGQELDVLELVTLFERLVQEAQSPPVCWLEQVHSMPKQGVASSFQFGRGIGAIEGIIASQRLSVRLVTPQRWKKEAGLLKKPKETSITLAKSLYPAVSGQLQRKKDVGRADAMLIAHFGSLAENREAG